MTTDSTAPHRLSGSHTASPPAAPAPAHPDRDGELVGLRDGRRVRLRHVTPRDRQGLLTFLRQLSPESRRTRFFSAGCDLQRAADWAASADQRTQIGVVAVDPADTVVGHATCCRTDEDRAEVAVEIGETYRHLGLATILIGRLAREAEQTGVRRLVAEVLPENRGMLAVFHDGFDAHQASTLDEVDIDFPCGAWRLLGERFHA